MTQRLLVVTYRIRGDLVAFREGAARAVPSITRAPGLLWKIWGLDATRNEGLSAYLFADGPTAEAFASSSPVLAALRAHPDVTEVACRVLPVDPGLSAATNAGAALGLAAA